MVDGWKPVVIPEELYDVVKEEYQKKEADLKLRENVRSLTGFIAFLVREQLKEKGVI